MSERKEKRDFDFPGFDQPSITLFSGPSGIGKTSLVREFFIKNQIPRVNNAILACEYPDENPYEQILTMIVANNKDAKIIRTDCKNMDNIVGNLNKNEINFLFIDDQFNDNNFKLGKLGTVDSRHKNCTTFCITQNIHNDMKNFVHFRRQVRYFIIFTERGDRSILTFLRNAFPETAVGLKYRDLPATRWLCAIVTGKQIGRAHV